MIGYLGWKESRVRSSDVTVASSPVDQSPTLEPASPASSAALNAMPSESVLSANAVGQVFELAANAIYRLNIPPGQTLFSIERGSVGVAYDKAFASGCLSRDISVNTDFRRPYFLKACNENAVIRVTLSPAQVASPEPKIQSRRDTPVGFSITADRAERTFKLDGGNNYLLHFPDGDSVRMRVVDGSVYGRL